jgi:hypothetical protein
MVLASLRVGEERAGGGEFGAHTGDHQRGFGEEKKGSAGFMYSVGSMPDTRFCV